MGIGVYVVEVFEVVEVVGEEGASSFQNQEPESTPAPVSAKNVKRPSDRSRPPYGHLDVERSQLDWMGTRKRRDIPQGIRPASQPFRRTS